MFLSANSVMVFVAVAIVLLIVFIYFISSIVRSYKKRQENFDDDIQSLDVVHRNTMLSSAVEMQEYTFQNISREIHDNIGQQLSLAKLLLNTQTFTDLETTHLYLLDSADMVSNAINGLIDISKSMSSEVITNNGLIKAIEFEVTLLQRSNQYDISMETAGDVIFLDTEKEVALFRIVQECLQNIIKHAKASIIAIQLYYDEVDFFLSIKDNGKGFQRRRKPKGVGLKNIRNRTAVLQGSCSINSNEHGTLLIITVPIE